MAFARLNDDDSLAGAIIPAGDEPSGGMGPGGPPTQGGVITTVDPGRVDPPSNPKTGPVQQNRRSSRPPRPVGVVIVADDADASVTERTGPKLASRHLLKIATAARPQPPSGLQQPPLRGHSPNQPTSDAPQEVSDAAASAGYGTRYYTYKEEVPLKPGETLGFTRGRGYYARPKVAPQGATPPAARVPTAADPRPPASPTAVLPPVEQSEHLPPPEGKVSFEVHGRSGTLEYFKITKAGLAVTTLEAFAYLEWSIGSGSPTVTFTPGRNGVAITDGPLTITDPLIARLGKNFADSGDPQGLIVHQHTEPLAAHPVDVTFFGDRVNAEFVARTEGTSSIAPEGGIPALVDEVSAAIEGALPASLSFAARYSVRITLKVIPNPPSPPPIPPFVIPPIPVPWWVDVLIAAAVPVLESLRPGIPETP